MQISEAVSAIKARYPVERWGIFKPQYCAASKNGRPRDEERIAARERGDKFYFGNPCRVCEANKKYTSNGACWNCKQIRKLKK